MGTYLPPIENPQSTMMKLVYAMSRRQFGKVMTPLKVFAARMPLGFGMFTGKIAQLDKKLTLPERPSCWFASAWRSSMFACSA
jgi:hypothetical protein